MSVSEGHAATRITLIWVTLLAQVWAVAKCHVDLVRGTIVTGAYTDVHCLCCHEDHQSQAY